jgi:hypothetical protein
LIVVATSGEEEDRTQGGSHRQSKRPTHQTDLRN